MAVMMLLFVRESDHQQFYAPYHFYGITSDNFKKLETLVARYGGHYVRVLRDRIAELTADLNGTWFMSPLALAMEFD